MTDLRMFDPSRVRGIVEGLESELIGCQTALAEAKERIAVMEGALKKAQSSYQIIQAAKEGEDEYSYKEIVEIREEAIAAVDMAIAPARAKGEK